MKLKNLKTNFTMVPNQWLRARVSFKTVGLLVTLQSLPDDWNFTIAGLVSLTNEKKGTIQACVKEAMDAGFLVRRQINENGRFSHCVIELKAGKSAENTVGGNTGTGKTDDGKTATTKERYILKKDIQKNNTHVGTAKAAPTCAPEAYELAELLYRYILANKPNRKIDKNWRDKWALAIDRLHRIDNRGWKEIETIIVWSQEDSFWWRNILSGDKLREQFDTLEDQYADKKQTFVRIS